MEEQTCPQCRKTFSAYPSQQRVYCSRQCLVAARVAVKKKTGRYKLCEICGTEFWVIPAREASARYCSRSCKDSAVLLADHECVQCGKTFQAWPSERRRYCSHECATAHKTFRKGEPCETCGKTVDPKKNQTRFCSLACAHEATRKGEFVVCAGCGVQVYRRPNELQNRQNVFCSRKCHNESMRLAGPGAKFKMATGYVYVYFPSHPDCTKNGLVAEHRLVAEQELGRRLRRSEHVHHINGVKDDNRPKNLQVIEAGQHTRITIKATVAKRRSEAAELAEYRRRFGSLDQ